MEPKIKKTKELAIKAKEQEEQVEVAESEDDLGEAKSAKVSAGIIIPLSVKQKKARAKNKRAKQARNIN